MQKGRQSQGLELVLVSRQFRKQRLAVWAAGRGPDSSFAEGQTCHPNLPGSLRMPPEGQTCQQNMPGSRKHAARRLNGSQGLPLLLLFPVQCHGPMVSHLQSNLAALPPFSPAPIPPALDGVGTISPLRREPAGRSHFPAPVLHREGLSVGPPPTDKAHDVAPGRAHDGDRTNDDARERTRRPDQRRPSCTPPANSYGHLFFLRAPCIKQLFC